MEHENQDDNREVIENLTKAIERVVCSVLAAD
jgi:hypothetical protein